MRGSGGTLIAGGCFETGSASCELNLTLHVVTFVATTGAGLEHGEGQGEQTSGDSDAEHAHRRARHGRRAEDGRAVVRHGDNLPSALMSQYRCPRLIESTEAVPPQFLPRFLHYGAFSSGCLWKLRHPSGPLLSRHKGPKEPCTLSLAWHSDTRSENTRGEGGDFCR